MRGWLEKFLLAVLPWMITSVFFENDSGSEYYAINLISTLILLTILRNLLLSSFFNRICKVCCEKCFFWSSIPLNFKLFGFKWNEVFREAARDCFTGQNVSYMTGHALETKIMVIPIFRFDFKKLVCVQNTSEFLNTSAVCQNVVVWLLTLLLLMTIDNLKWFS